MSFCSLCGLAQSQEPEGQNADVKLTASLLSVCVGGGSAWLQGPHRTPKGIRLAKGGSRRCSAYSQEERTAPSRVGLLEAFVAQALNPCNPALFSPQLTNHLRAIHRQEVKATPSMGVAKTRTRFIAPGTTP